MSARLFRTCVIAAAGSAVALQRGRPFAGRRFFASATMAAPAAASERAARAARLRQKLSAARAQTAAPVAASPQRQILLDSATEQDWDAVVAALEPFMKENRVARLREMLDRRRGGLHLVLENIGDPHNAAAVLRTAEGLGVQHVHVIESISDFHVTDQFAGSAANRGRPRAAGTNLVSMGASRWLTVSRYTSSRTCLAALRELDLQVLTSDCPPLSDEEGSGVEEETAQQAQGEGGWQTHKSHQFEARPIDALDFGARPAGAALVFGNERRGVSKAFLERADGSFFLPMCGFTQSFNISVAAAMSLWAAIASGHFPEGSLPSEAKARLMARWLLRDVKAAKPILRAAGIEVDEF